MDALITKAGLQALLTAQKDGTVLNLNQIKISSTVITPTGDETSLASIVYAVPSNKITKTVEGVNLIVRVHLDNTVGTFAIGTFGIYTSDNVLFAVAAFPGAGAKIASNPPGVIGNDKTFYLIIKYDDLATSINLSVGDPLSDLLVPVGYPVGGTTVTARQMRLALSANISTISTAVAALGVTNAIRIGWETASPITKGDVVSEFIRTTLGYSSGQIDTLFTNAALQTP